MKVVFLTASTSRNAGGLYFTITNFTKALKKLGVDVMVVGIDDAFSAEDRVGFGNVPVLSYTTVQLPLLSTFGMSKDLSNILVNIQPDIIHLQGIWMYHSLAALKYRKKHPNTKIIIEPHGMLDPWAVNNSKWKKKIVGHWFEYANLRKADYIHALCESEAKSIRAFNLTNPIAIIPNGCNIPDQIVHAKPDGKKRLLYIGRIHPKKGLSQLIEAIKIIKEQYPDIFSNWQLRIAGWDQNNYRSELESSVDKYGLVDLVKFIGPVIGEAKEKELSNADAFILPSFSEGLPMSILEAWSFGLPVLMTDECNLPEGFKYNAAIKITTHPAHISDGIVRFLKIDNETRTQMSNNAIHIVNELFSWDKIAANTIQLYNKILSDRNY